ncbi:hypothetical protein [Methylosinus sp. Sm6]|uniref:hypothetical protein n=1 Tax=Methylosinus sp. Sm6 TaxID=2866948 RepID=UPI001C990C4E|nr:hypothetical protein [Methylosinus sp. Sm6]MBY6239829.1 hypothetical protein [Methylosinus sp. Sm6]
MAEAPGFRRADGIRSRVYHKVLEGGEWKLLERTERLVATLPRQDDAETMLDLFAKRSGVAAADGADTVD